MPSKLTRFSKKQGIISFSESDLRDKVREFYTHLPDSFLGEDNGRFIEEYRIPDTRIATEYENRKLDEVAFLEQRGVPKVIVIEYKRGQITEADVKECLLARAYFDLCVANFSDFSTFLFVGEQISGDAKKLIEQINKNIKKQDRGHDCKAVIKSVSYLEYVRRIYLYYRQWADDRLGTESIQSTAFSLYQDIPEWFDLNWLTTQLGELES